MARYAGQYTIFVIAVLSAMVLLFSCGNIDDNGIFVFRGDGPISTEIDHIVPVPNKWEYTVGTAFSKADMVVFAVYSTDTWEIPRDQVKVTLGYPDKPDEDDLTQYGDYYLRVIEDRLVIVRYGTLTAKYTITTREKSGGDEIIIEWPD
jgi:hypothetical protein